MAFSPWRVATMLKSFKTGCVFFFYARSHGQLQYHLCVTETRVAANDTWRRLGEITERAAHRGAEPAVVAPHRVLAFERRETTEA
jgi:hypothetical protein